MSKKFCFTVAVGCSIVFAGCDLSFYEAPMDIFTSYERYTGDSWLLDRYEQVVLKESSSAQVLSVIQQKDEFLSQSESVVAAWGDKRSGSMLWFSSVAFDEDLLTAKRKYSFVADERIKGYWTIPAQKLRFDAQAVINPQVLAEPYANENARRIAVLKQLLKDYSSDIVQLAPDSQTLTSGSMMARRVVNTVITRLEQNPAYATKLDKPNGLDFDHPVLGKGRAGLIITDDIADLTIKVGTTFLNQPRKP
ncbi:MAG TPA: hypothetical protein HPP87_12020 [Planctomycetes bacterium]|nr:hypothetical protein [Planctomycetota bacterium]